MTDVVSAQLQVTAQRVEAIRQLLEDPTAGTAASSGATSASTSFARMLAETLDTAATTQTPAPTDRRDARHRRLRPPR